MPATAVTLARVREEAKSVLGEIRREAGDDWSQGHYERAAAHLDRLTAADTFAPFLTLDAYEDID